MTVADRDHAGGIAAVLLAAGLAVCGCDSTAKPRVGGSATATASASAATPAGAVEIVMLPASDTPLSEVVQREAARARADDRELLVYVGAEWCEPCTRFHNAAKAGELDATFPRLRLLELDHDRDNARLKQAKCLSKMIPLFAKPDAAGHCSSVRMFGSVKGPGAVPNITPRLQRLLATPLP